MLRTEDAEEFEHTVPFGIITKLMVLRANGRWSYKYNMHLLSCSSSELHLELSLTFLVGLLLHKRDQMLELVYQFVKMVIISMHTLKLLRKFSTKK